MKRKMNIYSVCANFRSETVRSKLVRPTAKRFFRSIGFKVVIDNLEQTNSESCQFVTCKKCDDKSAAEQSKIHHLIQT